MSDNTSPSPQKKPTNRRVSFAVVTVAILLSVGLASWMAIHKESVHASHSEIAKENEKAGREILDQFLDDLRTVHLKQPYPQLLTTQGFHEYLTNSLPPALAKYHLVDGTITPLRTQTTVRVDEPVISLLGPELREWMSYPVTYSQYRISLHVRKAPAQQDDQGITLQTQLTTYQIPLSNFAIFYENDLELDSMREMNIYGRIHTNADLYLTTSNKITLHGKCEAAGNFYGGIYKSGYPSRSWSPRDTIYLASEPPAEPGAPTLFTEKLRRNFVLNSGYLASVNYNGQPNNPSAWTTNPLWLSASVETFRGMLRDSAHGVERHRLPLPKEKSPYLLIESPDPENDPPEKRAVNFAYRASVLFSATSNWPETEADFSATAMGANATHACATQYIPAHNPNTPISLFSLNWLYDGREEKYVKIVDLDMIRLAEYLEANSSPYPAELEKFTLKSYQMDFNDGIIYVHLPQPENKRSIVALRLTNSSDLAPIVRRANLAGGLTIATNAPLYLKGDFNAPSIAYGNTPLPVLLASDAITVLSNAFSDVAYGEDGNWGNGPFNAAVDTSTNAVVISGNVPTLTTFNDPEGLNREQYSGGGENFFRYLERWGGAVHRFQGSMLNLYESRVASAPWDKKPDQTQDTGYFSSPVRDWRWNPRLTGGEIPPGMPGIWKVNMEYPGIVKDTGASDK